MKRCIVSLLVIALAFSLVIIPTESAQYYHFGYYNSYFWYVYQDGNRPVSKGGGWTLHVSWNGFKGMPDNLETHSWKDYQDEIIEVIIHNDVHNIVMGSFANLPNLTRVTIPNSVYYISNEAFKNCTSLTSITIPSSVVEINSSAFYNCSSLTSVTLPEKLYHLGPHAFANTGITSIHIPSSIEHIGSDPFDGCDLTQVYYCGTEEQWNQIDFWGSDDWVKPILSYHNWQAATCDKPKTCLYCAATEGSPNGHTWRDATCLSPKKCSCGATEGEPLGHNYTSEITQAATCKTAGRMTYTCTRCDSSYSQAIEMLPHTYGAWEPQQYISTRHSRICTICGSGESGTCTYDEGIVTQEPTCGTPGWSTHTCVCGRTQTRTIDPLPHGECKWEYNSSSNHKLVCTVCNKSTGELESHTWDDGVVTKDATCSNSGEKTYTCTACGGTKKETINKLTSHQYPDAWIFQNDYRHYRECTICGLKEYSSHTWVFSSEKEPTCIEEGNIRYICTICNGIDEYTIEKLTEHTYDNSCDAQCNVCGEIRTVSHRYSPSWTKTADLHYHECRICGLQADISPHVPGPAATETTPQTCTVCKYVLAPTLNHTHDFASTWSTNRDGHWHNCVGCEAQQSYAAHRFDNACDATCNDCGYEVSITHTYSSTYKHDANGHWLECTVCGTPKDASAHIPGPAPTATTAQNCISCGYEIAPPTPDPTEPSTEPPVTDPTTATTVTPPSTPDVQNEATSNNAENSPAEDTASFPWPVLLLFPVVIIGVAIFLIVKKKKNQQLV